MFKDATALLSAVVLSFAAVPSIAGPASVEKACSALQDIAVPTYPDDAIAAGLSGDVVLVLAVAEDGSVAGVELSSGAAAFADPARAAAQKWRFAKGPLARSVPREVVIVYRFTTARGVVTLSNEQKRLTVIVPSEIAESDVVESGSLTGLLAATRSQPGFPGGIDRRDQRIVVDVETRTDGSVGKVRSSAGDRSYRAAAEDAARHWTFRDIRRNGTPVRLRGQLTFVWRIG